MSKIMKICDGNEAAAYVAYAFSEAIMSGSKKLSPFGKRATCRFMST